MTRRSQDLTPPPWRVALPRLALRCAIVIGAAVLLVSLYDLAMTLSDQLPAADRIAMRIGLTCGVLLLYAILISVPFVPGIEIGLSLLVMRGADIAPAVYLATVLGMLFAYLLGRYLPITVLHRLFLDLHMKSACRMIADIAPLSPKGRLALLRDRLPAWAATWLVDYRYLALALLVNLPGNALIGGGGGLSLLAGLSRVFSALPVVLTLCLAVAPVPLAVWLFGNGFLS
ncbi:hypothetical protein E2K80_06255 [Rhodophyticola sp. CCM32]|uniref:hypothetical protein n=1 Tax=Rhodophyticola sp. CCM32 TaxID=2916397 RepID=UPI00107FCCAC|nr:hypothetical protein [Rhodophyticola sp. CCM32]QBY00390.1 hypothetical protein E2K80_06255 [Rhodophyticola sp. CCM32]